MKETLLSSTWPGYKANAPYMVHTQAVATAAQGTEVPYQVLHRVSLHTAALI